MKTSVMPTLRPRTPIAISCFPSADVQPRPWQGGAEHRNERTGQCVSEEPQATTPPQAGSTSASSHLYLDVDARGERESHQCVHRLGRWIEDVNQALVGPDLELLAA